jgi:hypothetical protein
VDDVALVGPEDAEGPDVRGSLDEDDVARVAEDAGHEVEGHLGAGRDDDVVGVRGDPDLPDHLEDLLAQGDVALPRAVLQGLGPALVQQPLGGAGQHLHGQGLDEGHPAGQRHDLGPGGDGEEGADLGGAHVVCARSVGVHPWVEP